MLSHRLLNNHAGVLLVGEYESLHWLHEVVSDVNERSPIITNKEGWFLSLAYDVRKAYEQQRQILPPPRKDRARGVRFGVEIIWPALLFQQRMLRGSLSYLEHNRKHQAITYALEAVIEDALKEDFGDDADAVIEIWHRLNPQLREVDEFFDARCAIFCSWTKAERERHFLNLLESFTPMYDSFYPLRVRNGEKGLLSPEELKRWVGVEWPDPDW